MRHERINYSSSYSVLVLVLEENKHLLLNNLHILLLGGADGAFYIPQSLKVSTEVHRVQVGLGRVGVLLTSD